MQVSDNLFYGIDSGVWGGSGAFVLIGDAPRDIAIEHNTVSQSGNIIMAYGGSKADPKVVTGLVFRNNLIRHNDYGVIGSDRGIGSDTLQGFFPDAVFASNVIAGGDARRYPAGNTFVAAAGFDSTFVDAAAGDYRLKPGSRFGGAGSDGRDVGADIAAIARALGLRVPPR